MKAAIDPQLVLHDALWSDAKEVKEAKEAKEAEEEKDVDEAGDAQHGKLQEATDWDAQQRKLQEATDLGSSDDASMKAPLECPKAPQTSAAKADMNSSSPANSGDDEIVDMENLEKKLWTVLDEYHFGDTVLRLSRGNYKFGETSAAVRLDADGSIHVKAQDGEYLPISTFLDSISRKDEEPELPAVDPGAVQFAVVPPADPRVQLRTVVTAHGAVRRAASPPIA